MAGESDALFELGRALRVSGYSFVTVTPETHRRVNARAPALASSLRDVFGWSRPFVGETLPRGLRDLLAAAGALLEVDAGWKSAVRFSSLGDDLFVHSAYPTLESDAVFFGPDTYRFCAAIARTCASRPHGGRVVDIGCGSGAGGLVARHGADRVVLADVSRAALAHARVNARLAGCADVELVTSDVFASLAGDFDLVVANPPYLRDGLARTYRDGGGRHGEALSVRIAAESLARLTPGGTLVLYTGAPIVGGEDTFFREARPLVERRGISFRYEEIDPDVFGEELDDPAYAAVERIAAVVLTATRSSASTP